MYKKSKKIARTLRGTHYSNSLKLSTKKEKETTLVFGFLL